MKDDGLNDTQRGANKMIKRSECRCICHNDLGPTVLHVVPCCENDVCIIEYDPSFKIAHDKIAQTEAKPESVGIQINDHINKNIGVFERETWNAAIEAAALECKNYGYEPAGSIVDEIRKLKK